MCGMKSILDFLCNILSTFSNILSLFSSATIRILIRLDDILMGRQCDLQKGSIIFLMKGFKNGQWINQMERILNRMQGISNWDPRWSVEKFREKSIKKCINK